jgi:hypothetical protein
MDIYCRKTIIQVTHDRNYWQTNIVFTGLDIDDNAVLIILIRQTIEAINDTLFLTSTE